MKKRFKVKSEVFAYVQARDESDAIRRFREIINDANLSDTCQAPDVITTHAKDKHFKTEQLPF